MGGCEDEELRLRVEGEPEGEVKGEAEGIRRARPNSEKELISSVCPGMFSEMPSRLVLRSTRGG